MNFRKLSLSLLMFAGITLPAQAQDLAHIDAIIINGLKQMDEAVVLEWAVALNCFAQDTLANDPAFVSKGCLTHLNDVRDPQFFISLARVLSEYLVRKIENNDDIAQFALDILEAFVIGAKSKIHLITAEQRQQLAQMLYVQLMRANGQFDKKSV